MLLPGPLVKATLIRRYKRFLADATLCDGREITAHIANPGSMMGLAEPGMTIWLSQNDDPKRKLKYSWELVELGGGHCSGVSTAHPNRIVEEALIAGAVAELAAYKTLKREVKYGKNSRIDFLLRQDGLPDAYVEVKNVHLRRAGDWAEFPDSVTARGAKHLEELGDMVAEGHRAVMLYLVQRTDCARFKLAADIDPGYAAAFERAMARGVEAVAYACAISPLCADARRSVTLSGAVPIHPASAG